MHLAELLSAAGAGELPGDQPETAAARPRRPPALMTTGLPAAAALGAAGLGAAVARRALRSR